MSMPTPSIDVLLTEIRKTKGEARRKAIAGLKNLATDELHRQDAVQGLIQLWLQHFLAPSELAPYLDTVIALWVGLFDRLRPLQKDAAAVDWLVEHEYASLSSEAEVLVDLLGYLTGRDIGKYLHDALQLTDPLIKAWAAASLWRRGEIVSAEDIEAAACSHLARITVWEKLCEMGREEVMPPSWALPEKLAESALSRWLSRPTELGTFPGEIGLMRSFRVEDDEGRLDCAYLFRFREFAKPREQGEGWMAGMAGPYRDGKPLDSPWSSFKVWDSMSPEEHIRLLLSHGGGVCGVA